MARKRKVTKKRQCSLCRRSGHDKRNCPRAHKKKKSSAATKVITGFEKKGGRKYPDYFYQNAPSWVVNLNAAKVKITPQTIGGVKKYCGNCSHLKQDRGFAGEPYCARNKAAVRGHWYCSRWKKGSVATVKLKVQGLDV